MTNLPDHLRPWSTIDDEELKLLRLAVRLAAEGNFTVAQDIAQQWRARFGKKP